MLPGLRVGSTLRFMCRWRQRAKAGVGRRPPPSAVALMAAALLQSVACRSRSDATGRSRSDPDEERVNAEGATFSPGLCKAVSSDGKTTGEAGPCSCGHDVAGLHPWITRVHYGFTSQHGGMSRLLWTNGCVMSSYKRERTRPRVADEMGCVSADCVRAVWSLAAKVRGESSQRKPSGSPTDHQVWLNFTVQHEVGDGVSWGLKDGAPTDATKRLAALMDAMGPTVPTITR